MTVIFSEKDVDKLEKHIVNSLTFITHNEIPETITSKDLEKIGFYALYNA